MKIENRKQKKHVISANVSEEIVSMVEYLAACHGVSKSSVIEQILEHHKEMILGEEGKENVGS